jgi:pimeloyl-ACP methyl ester carboxylesterase
LREWGSGERRLLLLHGLSSNAALWWRVGPALADLDYRVTAPDLRGHGASPEADDYTVAGYAADVLALADQWDAVLAHSLGGATILTALAEHPGLTSRLVLEDPWLVNPDADWAAGWLLQDFAEGTTLEDVMRNNPSWNPEDARLKYEALQQMSAETVRATAHQNAGMNLIGALVGLQVRTLLLGADPDMGPLVPPALGTSIAEMNSRVTFMTIPNGSHSMHRDQFIPFVEAVGEFLESDPLN